MHTQCISRVVCSIVCSRQLSSLFYEYTVFTLLSDLIIFLQKANNIPGVPQHFFIFFSGHQKAFCAKPDPSPTLLGIVPGFLLCLHTSAPSTRWGYQEHRCSWHPATFSIVSSEGKCFTAHLSKHVTCSWYSSSVLAELYFSQCPSATVHFLSSLQCLQE